MMRLAELIAELGQLYLIHGDVPIGIGSEDDRQTFKVKKAISVGEYNAMPMWANRASIKTIIKLIPEESS